MSPLAVNTGATPTAFVAVAPPRHDHLVEFSFTTVYARPDAPTLSIDHAGLLRHLRRDQADLVRRLFYSSDVAELDDLFMGIVTPYSELSQAIAHIMTAKLDEAKRRDVAFESIRRIRQEVAQAEGRLPTDVGQHVDFSLATLERALRLLSRVVGVDAPDDAADVELARQFNAHSLVTEISLHMLLLASRDAALPLKSHVVSAIVIGLRSSVSMYGAVSAAVRLRRNNDQTLAFDEVDALTEEEQQLLAWSGDDIDLDAVEDDDA